MGVDILNHNINFGSISTDKSSWSNSNATPTVTSVKRSLFGTVNHDEAMAFFESEFNKIYEEKKIKYNFDFVQDKPLSGPLKWEKVESVRSTTCRTRSPHKVTKCHRGKRSPLKSKVVNRDNVENLRSKQSSITDYLDISKTIQKRPANK